MGKNYVRLKYRDRDGKAHTIWAVKTAEGKYRECDRTGNIHLNGPTVDTRTMHILLLDPEDIVWEKPAVNSLHCGELTLVSLSQPRLTN